MIVMIVLATIAIFMMFFACTRAMESEENSSSSQEETLIRYDIIEANNNIKLLEITYAGQTHQFISLMMGPVTWSEPQHWPSCHYCSQNSDWHNDSGPKYSLTKPLPQIRKIDHLNFTPSIKGLEYPKTTE